MQQLRTFCSDPAIEVVDGMGFNRDFRAIVGGLPVDDGKIFILIEDFEAEAIHKEVQSFSHVVEEDLRNQTRHHNGVAALVIQLMAAWNGRKSSRELQPNDANDDEAQAYQAHWCSWLAEKGNAAKNGADGADASPDGVGGANGKRPGSDAEQADADKKPGNCGSSWPRACETVGELKTDG